MSADALRRDQRLGWMWAIVTDRVLDHLHRHPGVQALVPPTEAAVRSGELSPSLAADRILTAFEGPASQDSAPA